MDLFERCYEWKDWKVAQQLGFYPYFTPIESEAGPEVIIGGKRRIMLGSNNYMGLTNHPEVKEAAIKAVERYGSGCTGSRFLNGTLDIHVEFEQALADWLGKEAALVFTTGFMVNQGAISALVQKGDYILSDRLNHASIVEGSRLAAGETVRFKHNDMEDLERALKELPPDSGRLIVADAVFSAEGVCADQGHLDEVDLLMGTFSKSFGGVGGFIAGDLEVVMWIKHKARTMIFSASLPPASVASARKALDLIRAGDDRRAALWRNVKKMQEGLRGIGYDIGDTTSQIIPLHVGDDMRCLQFWRSLYDAGVFTNAFIAPATPPGGALIRTSYMPTHSEEMLDEALTLLEKVGKATGVVS